MSLRQCVSQLFERLIVYGLRLFLEGNYLLSLEKSGFRTELGGQYNIFVFKNPVEPSRAIGDYRLAIFRDVKKVYDRVS